MIQYSQLINKNGTIYNKFGATPNTLPDGGYPNAAALARDLGVAENKIVWNSITPNPNYTPNMPTQSTPTPAPAPAPAQNPAPQQTPTPYQPNPAPPQQQQPMLQQPTFVDYVRTNGSPTVFGKTPDGKWVAFENSNQFTSTGGNFNNVRIVGTAPTGAINFTQHVTQISGGTGSGTGTGTTPVPPTVNIPAELANDPYYKMLDDDNKATVAYYYSLLQGGNTDTIKKFNDAMTEAKNQGDPYWKEIVGITQDELARALGAADSDLVSKEKSLSEKMRQVRDDLTYNKDKLTLDQQAELAQELQRYGVDLDNTRSDMADRGLTSSTVRTKAEEQLYANDQQVVGSVNRKYDSAQRTNQVTADRSLFDFEQSLSDFRRTTQEKKTDLVRKTEAYLGTDDTSKIQGANSMVSGGKSGSIVTQKANDILARARALLTQGYAN